MSMHGVLVRLDDDELGSLRAVPAADAFERIEAWQADDGRTFHMGQKWQALHFAVSGMPDCDGVEGPPGFIGGTEDYGEYLGCVHNVAARLYDRDAAVAIASVLEALAQDVVAARLASDECDYIYPSIDDDEDRAGIIRTLAELRTFMSETAAKGMNVIVAIDGVPTVDWG
jgi:hypothetical protein